MVLGDQGHMLQLARRKGRRTRIRFSHRVTKDDTMLGNYSCGAAGSPSVRGSSAQATALPRHQVTGYLFGALQDEA